MKKLIGIISVLALLTSCGSHDDNAISFDVVKADKTVLLSNDPNSPTCKVHLEVASAQGEDQHKADVINNAIMKQLLDMQDISMQEAVDSFANVYTSNYVKNFLPLFNQDRDDKEKRAWYDYHYIIKSEAYAGHRGTTVYHVYLDYYEGGAHGINQHLTMNFERQTGRLLALSDIFVNGYEQQLNAILLKALREKTGAESLNELHDKGYLYSMDMFPSTNFALDEETITFIYNPYEIAPYAVGATELIISYSELEGILKNDFKP